MYAFACVIRLYGRHRRGKRMALMRGWDCCSCPEATAKQRTPPKYRSVKKEVSVKGTVQNMSPRAV